MTTEEQCTHLVLVRACAESPSGHCAQLKLGCLAQPSEEEINRAHELAVAMYVENFEEQPARVGVAVLPWVEEHDGDDIGEESQATATVTRVEVDI